MRRVGLELEGDAPRFRKISEDAEHAPAVAVLEPPLPHHPVAGQASQRADRRTADRRLAQSDVQERTVPLDQQVVRAVARNLHVLVVGKIDGAENADLPRQRLPFHPRQKTLDARVRDPGEEPAQIAVVGGEPEEHVNEIVIGLCEKMISGGGEAVAHRRPARPLRGLVVRVGGAVARHPLFPEQFEDVFPSSLVRDPERLGNLGSGGRPAHLDQPENPAAGIGKLVYTLRNHIDWRCRTGARTPCSRRPATYHAPRMAQFSPAWFLPGPHLQTIWGRLFRNRRLVPLRREVIETPDGDELMLDHLDVDVIPSVGEGSGGAGGSMHPPTHFILMHGLEGSAHSVYMQGILDAIRRHGASATAINFRSCARDLTTRFGTLPNRTARFYHSGEITDFDLVVRTLAQRMPGTRLVAFGASLGGNALLKWLAANSQQTLVTAAATLSAPYDLAAAGAHLESRIGRWYVGQFVRTLHKKVERVIREFPETRAVLDLDRIRRARTFREFDDAATAPLHGFRDADDYYLRSSSIHDIGRITTPTLCVSAEDDPFTPSSVLKRLIEEAPPSVEVLTTRSGGHTGFVSGSVPWRCVYWAETYVVEWLLAKADA